MADTGANLVFYATDLPHNAGDPHRHPNQPHITTVRSTDIASSLLKWLGRGRLYGASDQVMHNTRIQSRQKPIELGKGWYMRRYGAVGSGLLSSRCSGLQSFGHLSHI